MSDQPTHEVSELAKGIAEAADVAFGDFTCLRLTPGEITTLAQRISTAGLADLEADCDCYKDAYLACREGWNKATDYCHELEYRLAAAERERDEARGRLEKIKVFLPAHDDKGMWSWQVAGIRRLATEKGEQGG